MYRYLMISIGIHARADFTYLDTEELIERDEAVLALGSKVGVKVLFMDIEILEDGPLVGLMPDVAFVVPLGNPLIRMALIVISSPKGCSLMSLSLRKQFS